MTVLGMLLDGVSIFLVFLPLLYPLMLAFDWDPVWFGVLLTMKVAIGQFTPPMAVNLMVVCRIAQVRMEQTLPWISGVHDRCSFVARDLARPVLFRNSPCGCRATWVVLTPLTFESTKGDTDETP